MYVVTPRAPINVMSNYNSPIVGKVENEMGI